MGIGVRINFRIDLSSKVDFGTTRQYIPRYVEIYTIEQVWLLGHIAVHLGASQQQAFKQMESRKLYRRLTHPGDAKERPDFVVFLN
jgi:hypothetical protein